jgi:MFS transporter, OFA family, oxalate/formate antiporter
MLVTGAGLVLARFAESLTGLLSRLQRRPGLGVGLSYLPAISAVRRWLVRRRGLASGLAVSGAGVGTLVAPPLASALITTQGWRYVSVVLGLSRR